MYLGKDGCVAVCPNLLSIVVIMTPCPKATPEGNGLFLLILPGYSSSLREARAEIQGRNPTARTETETMQERSLVVCDLWINQFLY